jgi:hypothetical protein
MGFPTEGGDARQGWRDGDSNALCADRFSVELDASGNVEREPNSGSKSIAANSRRGRITMSALQTAATRERLL